MDQTLPFDQPKNNNEALVDRFKLIVKNLKQTTFVCQSANLPGITQTGIRVDNFNNYNMYNSQKLEYDPLMIRFKVDEDLNNVQELQHWLTGITAPQNPDQFKEITNELDFLGRSKGYNTSVDASLFTLTQVYNANIEIVYVNLMPLSFSGIDFDLTVDGHLTASAVFTYDYYFFRTK